MRINLAKIIFVFGRQFTTGSPRLRLNFLLHRLLCPEAYVNQNINPKIKIDKRR